MAVTASRWSRALAHEPAEQGADDEDENDQAADTKAQETAAGLRDELGNHAGHYQRWGSVAGTGWHHTAGQTVGFWILYWVLGGSGGVALKSDVANDPPPRGTIRSTSTISARTLSRRRGKRTGMVFGLSTKAVRSRVWVRNALARRFQLG